MKIGDKRQWLYMQKRAKTSEMRAFDKTQWAEGGETQASQQRDRKRKKTKDKEREIGGEGGNMCVLVAPVSNLWFVGASTGISEGFTSSKWTRWICNLSPFFPAWSLTAARSAADQRGMKMPLSMTTIYPSIRVPQCVCQYRSDAEKKWRKKRKKYQRPNNYFSMCRDYLAYCPARVLFWNKHKTPQLLECQDYPAHTRTHTVECVCRQCTITWRG